MTSLIMMLMLMTKKQVWLWQFLMPSCKLCSLYIYMHAKQKQKLEWLNIFCESIGCKRDNWKRNNNLFFIFFPLLLWKFLLPNYESNAFLIIIFVLSIIFVPSLKIMPHTTNNRRKNCDYCNFLFRQKNPHFLLFC